MLQAEHVSGAGRKSGERERRVIVYSGAGEGDIARSGEWG